MHAARVAQPHTRRERLEASLYVVDAGGERLHGPYGRHLRHGAYADVRALHVGDHVEGTGGRVGGKVGAAVPEAVVEPLGKPGDLVWTEREPNVGGYLSTHGQEANGRWAVRGGPGPRG